MDIFNLFNMVGGLALFLYGMNTMGYSLSKMAGGKLETILEKLTRRRIMAVLLGAMVTAVIQSSSATTVMVVGFVNSGIMKLTQAVGIIMGANIGTTVTSWILSLTGLDGHSFFIRMLKPSSFSPLLAAVGIIMIMTGKKESKRKDLGEILIGFAVLMFGMETMSSAVSGLKNNPSFTGLMTRFENPVLGMILGAILTAVIQSSSASVGILQALSVTGAIRYSSAIPIIMGQNIGTCITSILSSLGANRNAKRAAMIHLYFNLIGTILFMAVFYTLDTFISFSFLGESINQAGIAVVHTLFNIGATVVLFPLSGLLVKLAEKTIPSEKEGSEKDDVHIDERFIERPAFAMELARGKARELSDISCDAVNIAMSLLFEYNEEGKNRVTELETLADRYEDVLGSYLVKLTSKDLSAEDSRSMSVILQSISDFERISDHALEIADAAYEIERKGLSFTDSALDEIRKLTDAVKRNTEITCSSFRTLDTEEALNVEPLEQVIDTLTKKIKENHIKRLKSGQCTIEMGFILQDVLTALERISDHCSNIAVELITILDDTYNTHEYYNTLSNKAQADFDRTYKELLEEYQI